MVLISVIVPTYREAENVEQLVRRAFAATRSAGLPAEMVVVDDDSPDGTARVVEALSQRHPVRLVARKGKRGLASAVLDGFEQARGEILVVIDADLSHPPEKIPELVSVIASHRADFAIGSRYVRTGRVRNWPARRRIASRLATLLARPLVNAQDPLSGFFCLARSKLRSANRLAPVGYKIGLELMIKCRCRSIVEVPIVFTDRRAGESKAGLGQCIAYGRHLVRLYRYRICC